MEQDNNEIKYQQDLASAIEASQLQLQRDNDAIEQLSRDLNNVIILSRIEYQSIQNLDSMIICNCVVSMDIINQILSKLDLLDLENVLCVCQYFYYRLPYILKLLLKQMNITCIKVNSLNELLNKIDNSLPCFPRTIVTKWMISNDWRIRLAALKSYNNLNWVYAGVTHNEPLISLEESEKIIKLLNDSNTTVCELAIIVVSKFNIR